jgi:hypothetical protein
MVNYLFGFQNSLNHFSYFQYDLVGETDHKGDRDPKKRAAEIIAKLDVTGDKKLNKEEFTNGYVCTMILNILLFIFFFHLLDAKMMKLSVIYLLLVPNYSKNSLFQKHFIVIYFLCLILTK